MSLEIHLDSGHKFEGSPNLALRYLATKVPVLTQLSLMELADRQVTSVNLLSRCGSQSKQIKDLIGRNPKFQISEEETNEGQANDVMKVTYTGTGTLAVALQAIFNLAWEIDQLHEAYFPPVYGSWITE
jgi:hypothetical protein